MKKKPPVGLIVLFVAVLLVMVFFIGALASLLTQTELPPPTRPAQTYVLPGTSNVQMTGCNSGGACATLCWDGEAFVTCPE